MITLMNRLIKSILFSVGVFLSATLFIWLVVHIPIITAALIVFVAVTFMAYHTVFSPDPSELNFRGLPPE